MIVVTGGTGLVGAHLLYQLLCHSSDTIRALYRKKDTSLLERLFQTYNPTATHLLSRIEWVKADILDVPALEEAMRGATHVYHCAAKVSFAPHEATLLLKTNIEGTANVVNIALHEGVKKLCYVSSIATFSPKEGEQVSEQTEQELSRERGNEYALSKYSAEMEVWRGVQEGLPAVVVYPSVIIGVGVELHPAMNVKQLCQTRYVTSGGTGFVAATDVAQAMHLLMESPIENEGFILNGTNLHYAEFFELLRQSHPALPQKKLLSPTALRMLSYMEVLLSLIGRRRLLTRKMLRTLQHMSYYNGNKITHVLSFSYTPIEKTLEKLSL